MVGAEVKITSCATKTKYTYYTYYKDQHEEEEIKIEDENPTLVFETQGTYIVKQYVVGETNALRELEKTIIVKAK